MTPDMNTQLDDIGLITFAIDIGARPAEGFQRFIIKLHQGAIDIAANLALASRNHTVKSVVKKIPCHCSIPFQGPWTGSCCIAI